ncbi:pyruvate kinase [Methylacidimicrobium cyclopophantes]|uniref:pyruvate kinase n=1 Tax=Methylacidimicrobium cyclopophantes TaxID=1041766 RepID=A0A5E6MC28_9BACT|nr:pyruvate kinase [Methylacidimicrobium cyclopophantes]VVM06788.1 pyruvate kinase [Methylacidimicrobium cyclopophantes]
MNSHRLVKELVQIGEAALSLEEKFRSWIEKVHPNHRASARNLVHYLALRRFDLRPLQEELADRGLSSLGRAESCVLFSLRAVLQALGEELPSSLDKGIPPLTRIEGGKLLHLHTTALLGPKPAGRKSAIMVTIPTVAAQDPKLAHRLLEAGMDVARINCTHDSEAIWLRMVENLRRAAGEAGRPIRIIMDLAGPKLRTGAIRQGPRFCAWKPVIDPFGRRIEPARIWLAAETSRPLAPEGISAALVFPESWLRHLSPGGEIRFFDIRGKPRSLRIVERLEGGLLAESLQSATVSEETAFVAFDRSPQGTGFRQWTEFARSMGDASSFLLLHRGSRFRLIAPDGPSAGNREGSGSLPAIEIEPAEVLGSLRADQTIWFDDGRIGGVVRSAEPEEVVVEATRVRPQGEKLGRNRGINLPETDLALPSLSTKDRALLPWIIQHADGIGLSFVRTPADVAALQEALRRMGGEKLPIIVKIETRKAFEALPAILLTAMKSPSVGVMIARGDLAIECGYERLAEVQEEILWVAEAAHLPVIWATQVLETLATTGLPSRAEVTDAAMAERSECVMLNKGPHIEEALRFLDDVLRRMEAHQAKKRSMLRHLHLADLFEESGGHLPKRPPAAAKRAAPKSETR